METKDPNYVANLLQELEELKKKKARRMERLKKLEKHKPKVQSIVTDSLGKSAATTPLHSVQNILSEVQISKSSESNPDIFCVPESKYHNERTIPRNDVQSQTEICVSANKTLSSGNTISDQSIGLNASPGEKTAKANYSIGSATELHGFVSNCDSPSTLNKGVTTCESVKETFNTSSEDSERRCGKRSTYVTKRTLEDIGYGNTKRCKLAEDVLISNSELDDSLVSGNVSNKVKSTEEIVSVNEPSCQISDEAPIDRMDDPEGNDHVVNDTSHNMTSFFSCSLIGNEDEFENASDGIGSGDHFPVPSLVENSHSKSVAEKNSTECEAQKWSQHSDIERSWHLKECSKNIKSSVESNNGLQSPEVPCSNQNSVTNAEELRLVSNVGHENTANIIPESSFNPCDVIGSGLKSTLDAFYGSPEKAFASDQTLDGGIVNGDISFCSKTQGKLADVNVPCSKRIYLPKHGEYLPSSEDSSSRHRSVIDCDKGDTATEDECRLFEIVDEGDNNSTPSLLDSTLGKNHLTKCKGSEVHRKFPPEVSISKCSKNEPSDFDALTDDIDFNSMPMSVEIIDSGTDLEKESQNNKRIPITAPNCSEFVDEVVNDTQLFIPETTELFTIPETEFFDTSFGEMDSCVENLPKPQDEFMQNENKKLCNSEQRNLDGPFLKISNPVCTVSKTESCSTISTLSKDLTSNYREKCYESNIFEEQFSQACEGFDEPQTVQDTLLLEAEDTQDLGSYKNIPFLENEQQKSHLVQQTEVTANHDSNVSFRCCLHSDIQEPVKDIKLVLFNCCNYAFIQHLTWILVWRQNTDGDWLKIFSHQVDEKLQLKEICFSKDENHLMLVMLLCNEQVHCLQFLLFEKEARVVKLMEHTHWLQNRVGEEIVLLCGLDGLRFVTSHGQETFKVFVHVFSGLEDNPRLLTAMLGSTLGRLQSLCRIDKLPNALLGVSERMLYVWHLLEARLVTSVSLQLPDLLVIHSCIWATIENGLIFLMTISKENVNSQMCKLIAANLATGFCQIAMTYSLQPSREEDYLTAGNLKATYSEPFLAVSCEGGGFLWSVADEYCCAALDSKSDVTTVAVGGNSDDRVPIAVGNGAGSVIIYSLDNS